MPVELLPQNQNKTYLPTKAIPNSTNLLHTQRLTDILDRLLNERINNVSLVLRQPSTQISLAGVHVCNADLVALEQVRDDG